MPDGHRYWSVDLAVWLEEQSGAAERKIAELRAAAEPEEIAALAVEVEDLAKCDSTWSADEVAAREAEHANAAARLAAAREGHAEGVAAAIRMLSDRADAMRSRALGLHHFRMPRYSEAFALSALLQEHQRREDYTGVMLESVPLFGAYLGLCWHNRTYELSTPRPELPRDPADTARVLRCYGSEVVDELQDHYTLEELQAMYLRSIEEVNRRLNITTMAAQRAGFFG